jgi:transmembrane sensor
MNPISSEKIAKLILQHLDTDPGAEAQTELQEWLLINIEHRKLYDQLDNPETLRSLVKEYYARKQRMSNKIQQLSGITFKPINVKRTTRIAHRVHFLRTAWFRYAAAILIIFCAAIYFLIPKNTTQPTPPIASTTIISPGSDKATLILGDESVITLDSSATGKLAAQGSTDIIKTSTGEIIYTKNANTSETAFYQKLITPRGGQYQVTLSDGTQVWLNAASSIRFPSVFTNATREVEITGEVYVEVAKNERQPFVVKTSKELITVLGTSFNINSYTDEPSAKTSLITGAVKVEMLHERGEEVTLKPGQAFSNGKIINTNTQQDIAWKNGSFGFDQLNIKEAMRQISRWYDVKIKYEGEIPETIIYGEADRNLTLNDLIKGYEGAIAHFELKGNTLIVRPL